MVKWINQSHPQVLTGAIVLGYINAFSVLIDGTSNFSGAGIIFFPLVIALAAGAVGTANNKKIGLLALTIAAGTRVALQLYRIGATQGLDGINSRVYLTLTIINSMIFSVALVAAAVHPKTLEFRKIWFE